MIGQVNGSSPECDLLQALYDGSQMTNEWTGWRDNINEKAAYYILNIAKGIAINQVCSG